MKLAGNVALVTGSSRGIGRAVAVKLSSLGASVCINYNTNKKAAEETQEMLKGESVVHQCDVSVPGDVKKMFNTIKETLGPVDILINNAGIIKDSYLAFMKEEDWDRVIDVNMKGTYLCMKNAARGMISGKKGRIINIGSDAGLMGDVQRINYSGAKAGIAGMTKAAARELASYNITVNCISPGLITTDMVEETDSKKQEAILRMIPMGRPGLAEEVATAAAFFACEESGYITGQVLRVDGGLYMG